jgi:hypothetical protein
VKEALLMNALNAVWEKKLVVVHTQKTSLKKQPNSLFINTALNNWHFVPVLIFSFN